MPIARRGASGSCSGQGALVIESSGLLESLRKEVGFHLGVARYPTPRGGRRPVPVDGLAAVLPLAAPAEQVAAAGSSAPGWSALSKRPSGAVRGRCPDPPLGPAVACG